MEFSPLADVSDEMEKALKGIAENLPVPKADPVDKPGGSPRVKSTPALAPAAPLIEQSGSAPPRVTSDPVEEAVELPGNSTLININKASSARLEELPGIGPSKAKAIVEYREKNGSFKSAQQLMEVKGIGPRIFAGLKDRIIIR